MYAKFYILRNIWLESYVHDTPKGTREDWRRSCYNDSSTNGLLRFQNNPFMRHFLVISTFYLHQGSMRYEMCSKAFKYICFGKLIYTLSFLGANSLIALVASNTHNKLVNSIFDHIKRTNCHVISLSLISFKNHVLLESCKCLQWCRGFHILVAFGIYMSHVLQYHKVYNQWCYNNVLASSKVGEELQASMDFFGWIATYYFFY